MSAGASRGLVQGGGTVTPTTLLDALPKLEIISVFGVGYDGVPTDYCRTRGIKVTNTPDVLTDDVADVAVALILMTGRGFVRANRFVQRGRVDAARSRVDDEARRTHGGHPGTRPHRQGDRRARQRDGHAGRVHGAQAAGRAVSVCRRASMRSRRMPTSSSSPVRAARRRATSSMRRILAALGAKGTLINIARGSIIDEPALVQALARRHDQGGGTRRVRGRAAHPPGAARDGQRRAAAARRQRDAARRARRWATCARRISTSWFAAHSVLTLIPELR